MSVVGGRRLPGRSEEGPPAATISKTKLACLRSRRPRCYVLNAAEYFRQASLLDAVALDPRMADAIELIPAARQPDDAWLQAGRHPGRVWFEVDAPAGEPSKWVTLFGTRVLDWWDGLAK